MPEKSGNKVNWIESFPCEEVCGKNLEVSNRRAQNCSRRDLGLVEWKAGDGSYTTWMGLPPDREGERLGLPFWNRPREPLDEGCPGGWYRCGFAYSLIPYLPTQSQSGFMDSPLLDRTAPRLVIEAVQRFKGCKAKVNAYYWEVANG